MTEQMMAQRWLEQFEFPTDENSDDALATICEALQEYPKFRAIGTVEELQALKEKSVVKKVLHHKQRTKNDFGCFVTDEFWVCPTCKKVHLEYYVCEYCDCGQHLDWECEVEKMSQGIIRMSNIPKCCSECISYRGGINYDKCRTKGKDLTSDDIWKCKPDWCPITEDKEQKIRNKAIEEFAERLKNKLVLRYGNATPTEQYVAMQVDAWCNEIAESMKGEKE